MSDTVIKVENLGKKYLIRHQQRERYTALRDVLANKAKGIGKKLLHPFALSSMPSADSSREEFWALKDVSFEVKQGDRVGIIGRNGAGKTTLLKLLSRITEPTTGRIRIKGRVASLLEVGTGFHPELTGRENIYLNGAILGMTKSEIKKKFDEIVDFAEIEKFLDTPVKRYSSGMYVRLAFAVAAHLEPEILLVDEVLAVGDAQFQKKCLGKMEEIGKQGRTVLFVSHNISAVKQLCSRAVLLSDGSIAYDATPVEAATYYMQNSAKANKHQRGTYHHKEGDGRAFITSITINGESESEPIVAIYDSITISVSFEIKKDIDEMEFLIFIHSVDGDVQVALLQRDTKSLIKPLSNKGTALVNFVDFLVPGKYMISTAICDKFGTIVDWVDQAESFIVDSSFSDGRKFDYRLGKFTVIGNWCLRY